MNSDVIQRILHLIAHVQDVSYSDFKKIRKYLQFTEYDSNYGQLFEEVEKFYQTRNKKFPDFSWVIRQFPSYYINYVQTSFHSDDIYVLISILRDQSYKNRVLSSTYNDDLDKSLSLLTEYKNDSASVIQAPTTSKEVFKDFDSERNLFGDGIKTGITQLDAQIDYLPYKNFTCILAPTKSFKTTTACNIVYDAIINQGKNVVYFTLEDQLKSVWANLLSKHSNNMGLPITTSEIKKYKLTKNRDNLFKKMQDNFDESMTGHLVVESAETSPSFTPDSLETTIRKYEKLWGKIDMVVIDHFSILDDPIPGQNLSGPALSKAYVRFLTKLSISFSKQGFVLLGLAQVTREYTEKLIKGEKINSTGAANTSEIERSCSLMLCTYSSPEMKKSGTLQIQVVVNRNGESDISMIVPIKPEFASVGETLIEDLDDETIDAIVNGDLSIPLKKYCNFGVSFKQFANDINKGI